MFSFFKKKKQPELPQIQQRPKDCFNAKVAGISQREKELFEVMGENPLFDSNKKELFELGMTNERVYEFRPIYTSHADLIPEPDNPYDPNAIKVLVNNLPVGYIKKDSTSRIRTLMENGKIKNVEADLHGGKYKLLLGKVPDDEDRDERISDFEFIKEEAPLSCKLTIWYFTD